MDKKNKELPIINRTLSKEENSVVDILRNESFSSITINKKNGKISLVEGLEVITDTNKISKILGQHSYQNVHIVQSKNQIVHINRTVKIKLLK